ncbi:MAG: hypothetical protein JWM89_580 [Acidimicrobiales bacterium]|nr:hypothetical protein [Acidimicrobiales bacterium]
MPAAAELVGPAAPAAPAAELLPAPAPAPAAERVVRTDPSGRFAQQVRQGWGIAADVSQDWAP